MPRVRDEKLALSTAAYELGLSADQVRRRVQAGKLAGGVDAGRWYAWRSAVTRAKREATRAAGVPAAAAATPPQAA